MLTVEQRRVYDHIQLGRNTFITGQAGTGKSFLINYIARNARRNVAVTALTGVAASLIGGTTVHRWAGIRLGQGTVDELIAKMNFSAKGNWREVDILIIDEISMMDPILFDKLEEIGRRLRRSAAAFGGIQLVLCGDFFQLPPVKCERFVFDAESWPTIIDCSRKGTISNTFILTKQIRQDGDELFKRILQEARIGALSADSAKVLESRVGVDISANGIKPTILYSLRRDVDSINEKELEKISARVYSFEARDTGAPAVLDMHCIARRVLRLKVGAQVMLIFNLNLAAGLVNGSRGVVVGFNQNKYPIVRFKCGEVAVEPQTWDQSHKVRLVRKQIPLILAYALTIHKAQGCTLDSVILDLGANVFEYGQFYTALSRARSLDSVSIRALDLSRNLAHPAALEFYS